MYTNTEDSRPEGCLQQSHESKKANQVKGSRVVHASDCMRATSSETLLRRVCGAVVLIGLVFALLCGNGVLDIATTAGVLIVCISAWYVLGKREFRRFPLFIGLFSFAYCLLVIFVVQNPQVSDFEDQINAARAFLAGDPDAYNGWLFVTWPDQIGYSLVDALLLSIVDKVAFLKIFEAACTAGIVVLSYYLIREASNERVAQCLSFLLAMFPTLAFAVGVANNQVLSAFLCLIAMWGFVLARKKLDSWRLLLVVYVLCGVTVALARFVRPDAVLVLAVLCLAALCCRYPGGRRSDCDSSTSGNSLLRRITGAIAIAVPYLLVGALISFGLSASGVTSPDATGDRVVVNKLVMGTDAEASGGWSDDYIDNVESIAADAGISYQEAAFRVIWDQLTASGALPELLVKKAERLWWQDANTFNLMEADQTIKSWVYRVDKAMVFLLILLCTVSMAVRLREKRFSRDWFAICVPILALTILAYCLIEVQPRYLYFAYIIMFPIAADGMVCLPRVVHRRKRRGSS